jgi:restriction endonuclease S subunit
VRPTSDVPGFADSVNLASNDRGPTMRRISTKFWASQFLYHHVSGFFYKQILFVAKLATIQRNMKKKLAIIPRKI